MCSRLVGQDGDVAAILQFLPPEGRVFDAAVTAIMGQAFDLAVAELHDKGQPALVNEIIAKRIVEITASGERNPARIADAALQTLGLLRKAI